MGELANTEAILLPEEWKAKLEQLGMSLQKNQKTKAWLMMFVSPNSLWKPVMVEYKLFPFCLCIQLPTYKI